MPLGEGHGLRARKGLDFAIEKVRYAISVELSIVGRLNIADICKL